MFRWLTKLFKKREENRCAVCNAKNVAYIARMTQPPYTIETFCEECAAEVWGDLSALRVSHGGEKAKEKSVQRYKLTN